MARDAVVIEEGNGLVIVAVKEVIEDISNFFTPFPLSPSKGCQSMPLWGRKCRKKKKKGKRVTLG